MEHTLLRAHSPMPTTDSLLKTCATSVLDACSSRRTLRLGVSILWNMLIISPVDKGKVLIQSDP
jgi:hypothetical protein